MKTALFTAKVKAGRVNGQQVRVMLALGALFLFVIGAGAPGGGGGY